MKIETERKLMNFITLFYLIQGIFIYKKSLKKKDFLIKVQNKRLKKFIKYCYSFQFYKNRFDSLELKPDDIKNAADLSKLPPITKDEYRSWIQDELKSNPKKYKLYLENATSGSNGIPLVLKETPSGAASDIANLYRAVYMQDKGFRIFRDKIMHICTRSTGNRQSFVQKLGFFRYYKYAVSDGYDILIDKINTVRPDLLMANKTILLCLIEYSKKSKIQISKPKVILSMGEKLDENTRHLINQYFEEEIVFDAYGSTESGNFAIEKIGSSDDCHRIWHDTHVVTLLNPSKNSNGNLTGEILVTPMRHYGFPLINYRLGDNIEYDPDKYNGSIISVQGRVNDVIVGSSGMQYTGSDFMNLMNIVMRKGYQIKQYRIIKDDKSHLTWYFSVDDDFSDKSKSEVEFFLSDSRLKSDFCQDYCWGSHISPDENGKLRVLIDKSEVKK